jgi:hypothetical protein
MNGCFFLIEKEEPLLAFLEKDIFSFRSCRQLGSRITGSKDSGLSSILNIEENSLHGEKLGTSLD